MCVTLRNKKPTYRCSDLTELRAFNGIYIDKAQLHRLVAPDKYYAFARPRRFGKSLLVSTLNELFKGNRSSFLTHMKINTLILDDEATWRLTLSKMVELHPALNLIATCSSAMEAYAYLMEHEIDLLISDIELGEASPDLASPGEASPGEISGLMFARTFQQGPQIIFVTSHRHYAFDCYEVSPTDFLLKPLDRERFLRSIEKVKQRMLQSPETVSIDPYFVVKENTQFVQIAYREVLYMKAQEHFLQIVTPERTYMPTLSIATIEQKLKAGVFLRVHRSYLVHRSAIRFITKNDLTLVNDEVIPIGDQYRAQLNRKHIELNNVGKQY